MYGIIKAPATGLIFQKRIVVTKIIKSKMMISKNANPGFFKPKNIMDQRAFKTNCAPYTNSASFAPGRFF